MPLFLDLFVLSLSRDDYVYHIRLRRHFIHIFVQGYGKSSEQGIHDIKMFQCKLGERILLQVLQFVDCSMVALKLNNLFCVMKKVLFKLKMSQIILDICTYYITEIF